MKKSEMPFSLRARGSSFNYAFEGVVAFFRQEHNARIHLAATLIVVILSILLPVSKLEIAVLAIAVAFVWTAEIFNTAIEKAMDLISTVKDSRIKVIKDLAAAAVLIAAIAALLTGCIIFIPKLLP